VEFLSKLLALILSDQIGQAVIIAGLFVIISLIWLVRLSKSRATESKRAIFRPVMHFEAGSHRTGTRKRVPEQRKRSRSGRKSNEFGELVRTLRASRGVSIAFFANALNLTEADISKLEAGEIQPTIRILDDISLYLSLSREERSKLARLAPQNKNWK